MLLRRTGEQPLSFTQNMRLSLSPNMGLSLGLPLPPWDWRRGVRLPTHEIRPDGCTIKGNINAKGRRIYHVPGSASCTSLGLILPMNVNSTCTSRTT